jgi:hypothetical protein
LLRILISRQTSAMIAQRGDDPGHDAAGTVVYGSRRKIPRIQALSLKTSVDFSTAVRRMRQPALCRSATMGGKPKTGAGALLGVKIRKVHDLKAD